MLFNYAYTWIRLRTSFIFVLSFCFHVSHLKYVIGVVYWQMVEIVDDKVKSSEWKSVMPCDIWRARCCPSSCCSVTFYILWFMLLTERKTCVFQDGWPIGNAPIVNDVEHVRMYFIRKAKILRETNVLFIRWKWQVIYRSGFDFKICVRWRPVIFDFCSGQSMLSLTPIKTIRSDFCWLSWTKLTYTSCISFHSHNLSSRRCFAHNYFSP